MNFSESASPRLRQTKSPATPIVFVVDDDISILESLESLIRSAGWQPKTSATAEEFLALPRILTPSCLLLDVNLPDINGLDLQRLIADRAELPIIFITGHGDVPTTVQAMRAGAAEFLIKPLAGDVVMSAVRHALTRSHMALRHQVQLGILQNRYRSLSHRERAVMELVVSGRLNKQVGSELGISEITVKSHRGKMMRKMQAGTLVDLVKMAAGLDAARGQEALGGGLVRQDLRGWPAR